MDAPEAPISWGELIDKITILEIKSERLVANQALYSVRSELLLLLGLCDPIAAPPPELSDLRAELRRANERLWDIEDAIRRKEAQKQFDDEFIQLARSVYITNDERGRIKRAINQLLESEWRRGTTLLTRFESRDITSAPYSTSFDCCAASSFLAASLEWVITGPPLRRSDVSVQGSRLSP